MATECAALELELADVALGAVEAPAHLAGCETCRGRLEQHRAMWSAVKQLPRRSASPEVRAAVLAAATAPIVEPPGPTATGRDVRSQVLEAARQAAAGRPPKSLERFKNVPAAATAPPGAMPPVKRPAPVRLVAAVLAVAAVLMAWWLWPAEAPPALSPEPVAAGSPSDAATVVERSPVTPPPMVTAHEPVFAVVCGCRQPDQASARNAFLSAMPPGTRVLRPEDPLVESVAGVFAIGGDALDAVLALPASVPISYALVPGAYQRPRDRKAFELGLAPTRQQLEEIDVRLPGRRKVGVVVSRTISIAEIERASQDRASLLVRIDPPLSERWNDLGSVRRETGSIDVLWIIGLEGGLLAAVIDQAVRDDVPVVVSGVDASTYGAAVSFVPDPIQVGAAAAEALLGASVEPRRATHVTIVAGGLPSAPAKQVAPKPVDARVTQLTRMLVSARHMTSRARFIAMLGETMHADAVRPLCDLLRDPDVSIRIASVAALEKLRSVSALECLTAFTDPVPEAQERVVQAIAVLRAIAPRTIRLALSTGMTVSAQETSLAAELVRAELAKVNTAVEAADADGGSLHRYELRLQLKPNGAVGLKLEALVLVLSPTPAVQGTWTTKVNGGSYTQQLKVGIPRLVANIAADLDWK